jgi:hypothetical protein
MNVQGLSCVAETQIHRSTFSVLESLRQQRADACFLSDVHGLQDEEGGLAI